MSDISTHAMMREAAMMDASKNHVWARKVRRLCIERDKLQAQIAALPAASSEGDKLKRTIAARDRRIARLVEALDDARSQGYVTKSEQEPPIVLSAASSEDVRAEARKALMDARREILAMDTQKDEDTTYNLAVLRAAEKVRAILRALESDARAQEGGGV